MIIAMDKIIIGIGCFLLGDLIGLTGMVNGFHRMVALIQSSF